MPYKLRDLYISFYYSVVTENNLQFDITLKKFDHISLDKIHMLIKIKCKIHDKIKSKCYKVFRLSQNLDFF